MSQLFILGILAASFTAFLQEGFVLCCRLWISFSRFTQSCTFLFAVFPGSFLIFLAFSKLLLCKIFLVTVADFNLTRKRITDKIEVDVDMRLSSKEQKNLQKNKPYKGFSRFRTDLSLVGLTYTLYVLFLIMIMPHGHPFCYAAD